MPRRPGVRPLLALALALPLLAGCDSASRVVAVRLAAGVADTTFSLRVGQEARLADTVLRFTFLGVQNDSRCPSDVVCIWAGNAAVELGAAWGMGPTTRYVLNTTVDPRSLYVGAYLVTILDLQPYPVSTATIPTDRYVATFRLQRTGYGPD